MSGNAPRLRVTKDYSLFVRATDNRPVDMSKRKTLLDSMKEHGNIPAFPMLVRRTRNGKMEIRDGQHRFEAAKTLGLPVWFVECDTDAPIYVLNRPQKPWTPRDFAQCFADSGNPNYVTLVDIIKEFNAPTSVVARMITGSLNANIREFQTGNLVVKEKYIALTRRVLQSWMGLRQLAKHLGSGLCLQALWAAFHVDGVDADRIISGARRCREKLLAYSTVEGYLDMIEQLHNYGRRTPLPIKVPAQEIMRRRNPANRGKIEDVDK